MDRKIVELLVQGTGVNKIAGQLHVGKSRIRRLREQAKQYRYLDEAGRPGAVGLPSYPEALFPDTVDKRSLQLSDAHRKLESKHEWIRDCLQSGWHLVTVWEELPTQGIEGVRRSSFYRYVENHKLMRLGETYRRVVPEIIHQPGEALLLDWGKLRNAPDPETGKNRTLWFFAGVLGFSRLLVARLVWTIDTETTLRALESMLREIGGVPARLTIDNPKCVAIEASRYEPILNPAMERFAGHYGVLVEALPPRDPEKKGKIERPVPFIRRLYEAHGDAWHGLEESQQYLDRKLALANQRRHGTTLRRPRQQFDEIEAKALKALPALAYDIEQFHEGTVRQDGHVRFQSKYYSVDEDYIGKEVVVLGNSKLVSIYHGGRLLEVHDRIMDPNRSKSTKPYHLKPWERAMTDDSFYRERARKIGPSVEEMVVKIIRKGQGFINTRVIFGLLSLDKNYKAAEIDTACRQALATDRLSWRWVKDLLDAAQLAEAQREAGAQVQPQVPRPGAEYAHVRSLEVYQEQMLLFKNALPDDTTENMMH
jgi:transposase